MQATRLSRCHIDVVRRSIPVARCPTHVVSSRDTKKGPTSLNLTAAQAALDWSSNLLGLISLPPEAVM